MFVNLKVVLDHGKPKLITVITKNNYYNIRKISDIDIVFGTHIPVRVIFTRYLKPTTVEYYVLNFFKQSYLIVDHANTATTPDELLEYIEELEFKTKNPADTVHKNLTVYEVDNSPKHIVKNKLIEKPYSKILSSNDQVFFNSYLKEIANIYFL